jgi:hypothetical protein
MQAAFKPIVERVVVGVTIIATFRRSIQVGISGITLFLQQKNRKAELKSINN